ncbi:uncharacterized protein LOC6561160 [Drosophila grimshawi]|uniref:uncharacterized protein LOC6561160 n=1 Tax=Drosophila grimshawi TaxID=7222 RepID=UPI000C87131F|nr:uncharacterized protein LOC6561160 [Drosophila grimshawi]
MGYFAVLRKLDCVTNSMYITDANCNLIQPRNKSFNAALKLERKITLLIGYLEVSIPKPGKKKYQKIFDVTFELCKVLRERKRKTLIEILNSMTCLGNRVIQCPINPGFYQAKNITVVESLPPLLTESDFLIRFNWYLPRATMIMNITVLGRLYEISKENARKRKYF